MPERHKAFFTKSVRNFKKCVFCIFVSILGPTGWGEEVKLKSFISDGVLMY